MLAVFLERAGIATIVFGLVREHLEKTRPPRALWVPFELGRPLGGWSKDGGFQLEVLQAGLDLLDASGPVVLKDYAIEDPAASDDLAWQPPETSSAKTFKDEFDEIEKLWQQACQAGKLPSSRLQSVSGVSGLSIRESFDWLNCLHQDRPFPANDSKQNITDMMRVRFCADDIKAYYAELAFTTGNPTSRQLGSWFWQQSQAGQTLRDIRQANIESDNDLRAFVCGRLLVPGAWL